MKTRTVVLAAVVSGVAASVPSPCYADMVGFPTLTSPDSLPLVLGGLLFVAVVSGVSLVLLRRIARTRVDAAKPHDPTAGQDAESVSAGAGAEAVRHED